MHLLTTNKVPAGNVSTRNSTLELLRILLMFAIIMHHYCLHGGMINSTSVNLSSITVAIGASYGKVAVDIFVLMSGYFFIDNNKKNKVIAHAAKFYLQVWTTSIACLLTAIVVFKEHVSLKEIIESIVPIGSYQWWFASSYFILIVISPALNVYINCLSKNEQQKSIFVMLLLWSFPLFIPTLSYGYNGVTLFVLLYCVGAYIRKNNLNVKKRTNFVLVLLSVIIFPFISCVTLIASSRFSYLSGHLTHFVDSKSPITILFASAIFVFFISLRETRNKFICAISKTMFGVYLITDNLFIRPVLWGQIVHTQQQYTSKYIPVLMVLSSLAVFFVASIVEYARIILIQDPLVKAFKKAFFCFNCYRNQSGDLCK